MKKRFALTFARCHGDLHQLLLMLPLALWLLAGPAIAQVATRYTFQQSSGSFTNITGGNRLNTGNNSFDDQVYTRTIEPFFFDGNTYTSVNVSANGFLTFGSSSAGNNYTPISSNAGYDGAISAFGCNITNAASGIREIRHQRVGSEEVFQWRGARRSGQAESIDFQIRLNTDNGEITLRYNNANPSNSTANYPQVGLRGPNNTFATNVNNRRVDTSSGAGSTWANTAAGAANSSECRYNNWLAGRAPEDGQTYTWTPICLPVAATAEAFTNCGANTFTIEVTVTDLGGAAGVNIQAPIGTNVHTNVGLGSYTVGPFTIGQSRTVRVVHPASNLCDLDLGTFTSPTSCITAGNCYNGAPYPFSGNSCPSGSNRLQAGIAVSGFNNALNSNVVPQRVELIIAHGARGRVRVRLVSPSGQSRALITNRGGNFRSNFGNPGNCPSASFILDDAATQEVSAVPTGFGDDNVTGSWRPEETLAGFTGDPNGQWTIEICSSGGTAGSLRRVNLVFADLDCVGTPNGSALPGTACNDGDPTTVNDTWTNDCQCQGQPNILYSLAGGDHADNIWSYTPDGPAAGVIPDQNSSIVIRNGHHVTLTGTRQARSVTIESGGSFALGSGTLTVNGTALTNDGGFDGGTGTLVLAGGSTVAVSGSAPYDLFNLTVNNTAGATVDATVDVRNAFTLNAGTFTANLPVRLRSTATGTARLAPVADGASYVGHLTVERYIPGGVTNWRLLSSPVGGCTVLDWKDDFLMAGFPGSHHPSFSSGGQPWPSVRWYDETHPGTQQNDGLLGVNGTGHGLAAGQGFAAWSGDAAGGTNPFVVDVTGPPTIASSPVALPLSWTNTGNPAADGWNLVGNPLPSAISFTAIVRGADVQNAYWIFNPATGNNAVWSDGFGTHGATGVIQHSQGFWMRTTGPEATATVGENAKTSTVLGGLFGGSEQDMVPMVRLSLQRNGSAFSDEALVVFTTGTPATDAVEGDAEKIDLHHPQAPRISTLASDGTALAINRHGAFTTDIAVPVRVAAGQNGTHTLTVSGTDHLGLVCLSLEDLVTGTIIPLSEGATYIFGLQTTDDPSQPRLLLRASAPIPFAHSDASCFGANDGAAQLLLPGGSASVVWTDVQGNTVLAQNEVPAGSVAVQGLAAGHYQVAVAAACGQLALPFEITEPQPLEVFSTATPATCAGADGALQLDVFGGSAPYTLQWAHGASGAALQGLAAGAYTVAIADANGCALPALTLEVAAPDAIPGEVEAAVATAAGEAILFISTAPTGTSHFWDFGDGATSLAQTTEHTFAVPGTYTVTLTLGDGACARTLTHEVSVYTTTGLLDMEEDEVRDFSTGETLVLLNGLGAELHVHIYDATGRVQAMRRVPADSPRTEIDTHGWATGLYFLNARTPWAQWTFSLPVAR
jgi:hypothetical protein